MCADLVLLANRASSDKVFDIYGESRPPEVPFNNCLSAEASKVTEEGGRMDRVEQGEMSGWWNIHVFLVIQVSIVEGPV